MTFKLQPIEITAISLASIAVLLIISYAIYKLSSSCGCGCGCRTSSSASTTPIHESREAGHTLGGGYGGNGGYGGYGGYGHDPNNPYMNYDYTSTLDPYFASASASASASTPSSKARHIHTHMRGNTPIQSSPSTGQTSLVTPSTSGGSVRYQHQHQYQHKLKKGGLAISSPWQRDRDLSNSNDKEKEKEREGGVNDELVVVTYEDGLRKLGIQPIREAPYHQQQQQHQYQVDQRGDNGGSYGRYVPPINTNVSAIAPSRPELVERKSSRRTYHSTAGRGHDQGGGGRRAYATNTMGTTGSNLLPSYYVETNPGDE
ncbi:uncharacterized protein I303_104758 [Kwoniella dejecticola CBS 10117]|uniref:Uncharacterized protein n=1 Tax=Kwoniella dejecticola CBS 10117 TaxID=1296121 RepID=A0A1A6A4E4_9TREE|nr:uncharacterized protein I303_04261 [Kwoniella dejecticola CBS 10117]OBR84936.1 hypothetical protein I303_04261 [Kwoniella dejecticola CBS 10117]